MLKITGPLKTDYTVLFYVLCLRVHPHANKVFLRPPCLHNFNACIPECGNLGMRLQQSMKGMAKRMLKEFQEVSEVSNTLYQHEDVAVSRDTHSLPRQLLLSCTHWFHYGIYEHFGSLSSLPFSCQSPSFFFLALPLTLLKWDHYHAAVLGTMNSRKCTQVFVNRITHVQWWICYTLLYWLLSGSFALLKTGKQGQKDLLPVSCLIIVVQQQEARKQI